MVSAGYDMSPKVSGRLAPLVSQSMSSTPAPAGSSYAATIGGRVKAFSIDVGVQAHDVSQASFAIPNPLAPSGPRYLTGSTSLDFGCDVITWHHLSVHMHAGPALGGMIDRMTGGTYSAQGMRAGAGVSASLGPLTAFVDVTDTQLAFTDGPAAGNSTLTGVTVGIALR